MKTSQIENQLRMLHKALKDTWTGKAPAEMRPIIITKIVKYEEMLLDKVDA